jgi:hypothetical protein
MIMHLFFLYRHASKLCFNICVSLNGRRRRVQVGDALRLDRQLAEAGLCRK